MSVNWFLLTTVGLYVGAGAYEVWCHHTFTRDAAVYWSVALTNSVLALWGRI